MNVVRFLPAVFLFAASASFADCDRPAAPDIPDGASATEAEMVDGQSAVKTYMEGTNAFLDCLAKEQSEAGEADTPEEETAAQARVDAHNQAVDDMEGVAEQFNSQVRAWKAKSE